MVKETDKIGYKVTDRVDTNVKLGYQTLFSYYYEHEQGNISEDSLNENIAIYLKCGTFSYAEIPQQFDSILGVTGTLQSLPKIQHDMAKTYGISKLTIMPSSFGKNTFIFDEEKDVHCHDVSNYNKELASEIQRKLNPEEGVQKCVFVYFDDKIGLKAFYNCDEFKRLGTTTDAKDSIIKCAIKSGSITLMTTSFARGTDFDVIEKEMANNSSGHVIQTFFSAEPGEEIQIQGCAARQGKKGSYSMVLLDETLEKFGISAQDAQKAYSEQKLYALLKSKRGAFIETRHQEISQGVEQAKRSHKIGMSLIESLMSSDVSKVKNILFESNLGAAEHIDAKVVILIDATRSMGSLIAQLKNCIEEVCKRISITLKDNNKDPKSFRLQIMGYRNYNAPRDKILEYSGWSSDGTRLREFLANLKANWGVNNEAIEIGFQHIIDCEKESKNDQVSNVILIGDRPPNSKEEVLSKRTKNNVNNGYFNERYDWDTDPLYEKPVFCEEQLEFFQSKGIKIHTVYLEKQAKESFESIAKKTGGLCDYLDVSDVRKSSQMLTDLVCEEVLMVAQVDGSKLVRSYRNKIWS